MTLVARGGDFRKKIGGDKKKENLMKFSTFHLIRAAQSAAHLLLKEKAVKSDEKTASLIRRDRGGSFVLYEYRLKNPHKIKKRFNEPQTKEKPHKPYAHRLVWGRLEFL